MRSYIPGLQKSLLVFSFIIFLNREANGQDLVTRTGDSVTVLDERLAVGKTLSIPYGPAPSLQGGLSRPGSLFFNTTDSSLYVFQGLSNWKAVNRLSGSGTVGSLSKWVTTNVLGSAVAGTDYLEPSALTGYLQLSGGTLTGALNAAAAHFSGNVGIGTSSLPYKFQITDGNRTGIFNPSLTEDGFFIGTLENKPLLLGAGEQTKLVISHTGALTLKAEPPVSTEGYDFLTRNTSTGLIEKIGSTAFAPFTGSENYVNVGPSSLGTGTTKAQILGSGGGVSGYGSLALSNSGGSGNNYLGSLDFYAGTNHVSSIRSQVTSGGINGDLLFMTASPLTVKARLDNNGIFTSSMLAANGSSAGSTLKSLSLLNNSTPTGSNTKIAFNGINTCGASYEIGNIISKKVTNSGDISGSLTLSTMNSGVLAERLEIDHLGYLKLNTLPQTSNLGSFDYLTRNNTTGAIERMSTTSLVSATGAANRIPFYNASGVMADEAGFAYNSGSGLVLNNNSKIKISGGPAVEIGNGATTGSSMGVAIGNGASVTSSIGSESPIAIGAGANTGTSYRGIAIGLSASTNNTNSLVFGREALATGEGQIVFGRSTGENAQRYSEVFFNGALAQGNVGGLSVTLNGAGAGTGADLPGGSLTLASGKGTGAGIPGDLVFKTPALGPATSSNFQTLVPRMTIKGGTGEVIYNYLNTTTYAQSIQSPSFTGTIGNPTLAQDFYANTNGNESGIRSRFRTLQTVGSFDFRHDSGTAGSFRMYLTPSGTDESTLRETFRFKSDGTIQFFPTLSNVTAAIKASQSLVIESNNNGSVLLRSASGNGNVQIETQGGFSALSRTTTPGSLVGLASFTQASGNGVSFGMQSRINTAGGAEGFFTMGGSYATRFTISPGTTAGGGVKPTALHLKSGDAQPANSAMLNGADMFVYGGSGVSGGKFGNIVLQHDGAAIKNNVLIGTVTDDGINKLQVNGGIKAISMALGGTVESVGSYEILTRNTSTGIIERAPADAFMPAGGSGNYIQNQNATAQAGNLWIAGSGKFLNMFAEGVGIGTSNITGYPLTVNGTIKTKAIKVEPGSWSDYVFFKDYKLPSLREVEKFVKEKQHLPDMPSEAEVKKNGVELGEMNSLLLKKIEELTLYMIEKDKQLESANKKIEDLARKVEELGRKK